MFRPRHNPESDIKIPADLRKALKVLKMAGIDDMIYDVREREGKGWDGPKVKAFSNACDIINKYLRGDNDNSN